MSDNNQVTTPTTEQQSVQPSTQRADFSSENSQDQNGISLYIPFVFTYVTRQMVKEKMEEKFGTVSRVDMKFATNSKGQRHKKVYVHFKQNSWYQTEEAQKALGDLQKGESFQLPWVDNWFWKLYISKSKRLDFNRRENETNTSQEQ